MVAVTTLEAPHKLSLQTALSLFALKVAPTAAYGVQLIWKHLSEKNLGDLDRVKSTFLKRALGVHSNSRNRLVYLLSDTPLFMEDLRRSLRLEETPAYKDFIVTQENKMADIDPAFWSTPAMTNNSWRESNRPHRQVVTRFSIHGYHHVLCTTEGCYSPSVHCRCRFCGLPCPMYHATACDRVESLRQLARL